MQPLAIRSIAAVHPRGMQFDLEYFQMRKFMFAAASATFFVAVPAFAQDIVRAPFTGPRVEGLIGYDSVSDGNDQDSSASSGVVYGGAVGYDAQVGGVVLGVEGEITGSTTDTRTDNLINAGDRLRLDAGRDLYAGGRVGYVISPLAMIYAKGGYTNARVEARYDSGNVRIDDHADLDGFRIGAGLEYRLSGNTYVKGEYRYSNYSSVDGYDTDVDRHQLIAGLGLRF